MMICHFDLINSLFCIGLTQAEIDQFMGHLFDKDPPTVRPASMPAHFYSENPPSSVSITVSFGLPFNCS
jgi:hypothetical protein